MSLPCALVLLADFPLGNLLGHCKKRIAGLQGPPFGLIPAAGSSDAPAGKCLKLKYRVKDFWLLSYANKVTRTPELKFLKAHGDQEWIFVWQGCELSSVPRHGTNSWVQNSNSFF